MFQTRTPQEILHHGHHQAVKFGAPLEICANLLRHALAAEALPPAIKTPTLPLLREVEAE